MQLLPPPLSSSGAPLLIPTSIERCRPSYGLALQEEGSLMFCCVFHPSCLTERSSFDYKCVSEEINKLIDLSRYAKIIRYTFTHSAPHSLRKSSSPLNMVTFESQVDRQSRSSSLRSTTCRLCPTFPRTSDVTFLFYLLRVGPSASVRPPVYVCGRILDPLNELPLLI